MIKTSKEYSAFAILCFVTVATITLIHERSLQFKFCYKTKTCITNSDVRFAMNIMCIICYLHNYIMSNNAYKTDQERIVLSCISLSAIVGGDTDIIVVKMIGNET